MEFDVANWVPGLITMGVGLVGGTAAALKVTTRDRESATRDTRLQDIDERMSHLVAQLKDLDAQREGLQPEAYEAQKAEFEGLAAKALSERDRIEEEVAALEAKTKPEASAKAGEAAGGAVAKRPMLAGAVWGAGTALVMGFVFVSVFWDSSRGPADMQAAPSPMGQGQQQGPAQAAAAAPGQQESNPEIRALLGHLQTNPGDRGALNRLSHLLLEAQRPDDASPIVERVLQLDPANPEGRVHSAILQQVRGDQAAALATVEKVASDHPDTAEAWFFLGKLSMEKGDMGRMRESFTKFLALAPEGPLKAEVQNMLKQAQAGAQGSPASPQPKNTAVQ